MTASFISKLWRFQTFVFFASVFGFKRNCIQRSNNYFLVGAAGTEQTRIIMQTIKYDTADKSPDVEKV